MKNRPNAELQFTIKRIGTGSTYVLFNNRHQTVEAGPFYSAKDATDALIAASAIPGSVVTASTWRTRCSADEIAELEQGLFAGEYTERDIERWVSKHPIS